MSFKKSFAAAAAAGALLAPLTTHAAAIGFALTIDDATNTVTSNLAGIGITTLGTQLWRLDFSASSMTFFISGYEMSWISGDDDTGVNWIQREGSGSTFLLYGDTVLPGSTGDVCGSTPSPLLQGVTCFIGADTSDSYFVTVLDPTPTGTVSSPATLALAGLGLLAAAGVSRRRR